MIEVTGLETVDWHQLSWMVFAWVCFMVILVLKMPADAGVKHKKDDDDYPHFPAF